MSKEEMLFTTRRRVILVQMMYAFIINCEGLKDFDDKALNEILSMASSVSRYKLTSNKTDDDSDVEILMAIIKKIDKIDEVIKQNCESISRISRVILSILRVGAYELKYCNHKHTIGNIIKDYLNISVAFAHNLETGFINGILDKIQSSPD